MEKSLTGNDAIDESVPMFKCRVCGAPLYVTDLCNLEITFHCSSIDARFWEFERGSIEQIKTKEHWEQSREEIYSVKSELA